MAVPRLGVEFEAIYPYPLSQNELPSVRIDARPGALEFLLACKGTYRPLVYSAQGGLIIDLGMQAWLVVRYRRFYERINVDDPSTHLWLEAVKGIECVSRRPDGLHYDISRPLDAWPEGAELERFRVPGEALVSS